MSQYATLADMVKRFGESQITQLTDRATPGVIDEDVLNQALVDASAVVDGYLVGRFGNQLPLSPAPAVVVSYVCDLARQNLYPDAVPEEVEKRAARATRFFELVGQGKLNLGSSPEPSSNNTAQVISTERRRVGIGL